MSIVVNRSPISATAEHLFRFVSSAAFCQQDEYKLLNQTQVSANDCRARKSYRRAHLVPIGML